MSEDLQAMPVRFPRNIHDALRNKAFIERRSMSEIVVEAVRKDKEIARYIVKDPEEITP